MTDKETSLAFVERMESVEIPSHSVLIDREDFLILRRLAKTSALIEERRLDVMFATESTNTPIADRLDANGGAYATDEVRKLERENSRLREEVEMLNVRHAAAMLHAQTHADEYNALREDEKGLLQDIQWLTEEAFKRDEELSLANGTIESRDRNIATLQEELAEAKRDTGLAKLVIQQKQDQIASAEAALEQAEARALAAEKLHMDLIMQVARKWPNESRHETAKRYITEAENRPSSGPSQAAIGAKHG